MFLLSPVFDVTAANAVQRENQSALQLHLTRRWVRIENMAYRLPL